MPALDGAGVALALGGAADVYFIAGGKGIRLDDVPHRQGDLPQAELPQHSFGSHVRLGEVAPQGLGEPLVADRPETDLHGFITVVFGCLPLDDHAGASLHHGDGDDVPVFVKKLGHADLFADDALFHCVIPPVRLLVDSLVRGEPT